MSESGSKAPSLGDVDQQVENRKMCYCGSERKIWTYEKGDNTGFRFYCCRRFKNSLENGCGYFEWVDEIYDEIVKLK